MISLVYLKKQGVDLNVDLDALQTEYDKLKETHAELAGQLATVKKELQPMKDIRYWVGKVLTPEQSQVQKKSEPKHSPSEQIKFYQEQEKQKQEQKSPQHKKTEYGTLTDTCRFLCGNVECLCCSPKGGCNECI